MDLHRDSRIAALGGDTSRVQGGRGDCKHNHRSRLGWSVNFVYILWASGGSNLFQGLPITRIVRLLIVTLILSSLVWGEPYADPQGRFRLEMPAGWAASGAYLVSGKAYALPMVVARDGVEAMVAQFGKQWKEYRRVGNLSYAGINPSGVSAMVQVHTRPLGAEALMLLVSAPAAEWAGRQAEFGLMNESLQPNVAASTASANLAQAYKVPAPGGGSARGRVRAFLPALARQFDGPVRVVSALGDGGDTELQAFFRATRGNVPVRGWLGLSGEQIAVAYDEASQFGRSFPRMAAGLGVGAAAPATAAAPPAKVPLQRVAFPDGSGSIGVPPGWRFVDAQKGVVDVAGPNGAVAGFGYYQQVPLTWFGPRPNLPGLMVGPIREPATALRNYYDSVFQGALSSGRGTYRVVEGTPVAPLTAGAQTALLLVEVNIPPHRARSLALVSVAPVNNELWLFYLSQVAAPATDFAAQLPGMLQMWGSWSLNPAMLQERMNSALRTMRETSEILQGINRNQQRAGERGNLAWSQTIRGVRTVEDTATGRRGDVDMHLAERIVQGLNEQGYSYRIVPVPELVP
jgi:hypothetical protein